MATTQFKIHFADEASEKNFQRLTYGYGMIIESLVAEVSKINPEFSTSAVYIFRLGLSPEQTDDIVFTLMKMKEKGFKEKLSWLSDWMKTNVYEMPEEYLIKMLNTFLKDIAQF